MFLHPKCEGGCKKGRRETCPVWLRITFAKKNATWAAIFAEKPFYGNNSIQKFEEVLYKKGFSSQFQKYHPDKETNEAKDFNENGSYKKRCIVDGAQNRSSPFSLKR